MYRLELKQKKCIGVLPRIAVLIVPFGIETSINLLCINRKNQVLIVPFGIETCLSHAKLNLDLVVLIVPFGIETSRSYER